MNPQSGIDLEANYEEQEIQNIKIYHNKIHTDNYAIISSKNTRNVEIQDNEIYGKINVSEATEKIKFIRNSFRNAFLNIEQGENKIIKEVLVKENTFYNNRLRVKKIENINIEQNYLENSSVTIISSNANIYNNNMINASDKKESFAYRFRLEDGDMNNYIIFYKDNLIEGQYTMDLDIMDKPNLKVIRE